MSPMELIKKAFGIFKKQSRCAGQGGRCAV